MSGESREAEVFQGPGFDQLRVYLADIAVNSSHAQAALDIADKFEIGAVMMAGGGIAGRLAADHRNSPGGNFRRRTGAMFDDENANRQAANRITDRMTQRKREDPK